MRSLYFERDVPRALLVKALRRVWPGIVWSPVSPVRFARLDPPRLAGPDWVRVENLQCGICATDLSLVFIKADPGTSPVAVPRGQRLYLGHETVGRVVEAGAEVQRLRPGDRVIMGPRPFGPDCFTQHIRPACRMCAAGQTVLCENAGEGGTVGIGGGWGDAYTAHESQVWKVPGALNDDQATLVEPMAIAVHAVLRRRPQPGERVLVVGAGIIGLLVLQAVRAIEPQARLAVVARHSHQEAAARHLGAEEIVRGPEAYDQLARWTGARRFRAPMNRGMLLGGVDVVYDCVGSAGSLTDALRWIRARGTLVMVGIDLRFLRVDLNPIWHQEVTLTGASGYGLEPWNGQTRHAFDLVMEMLEEGVLRADGLITHRFPLTEYRQAIATAADKKTGSIKVIFDLSR